MVIWCLWTNVCTLVSKIDDKKGANEGLQKNMLFGTPSYQKKTTKRCFCWSDLLLLLLLLKLKIDPSHNSQIEVNSRTMGKICSQVLILMKDRCKMAT